MENEIIKERFLGTIFGQAIGDALGLSTEFMSKQEVGKSPLARMAIPI